MDLAPVHWMNAPRAGATAPLAGSLRDRRQRHWRDLRLSLTDRCNFRCSYCMPRERFGPGYRFLPNAQVLNFEEIVKMSRVAVAVALGVQTLRLTGGEPLLRRGLPDLAQALAQLRSPEGDPVDLALTTNGSLLAEHAESLREAGLRRLTVSLDALDDVTFRRMSDVDVGVQAVLDGLQAARAAGFERLKINAVLRKSANDDQIERLADFARREGHTLRFIEFVDAGCHNGWRMDEVIPSRDVLARLQAQWPMSPLAPSRTGETAERWAYDDGRGEVGLISSVTQAFCGDCTRARLTAEGHLVTCLFASGGTDLRPLLRGPQATEEALTEALTALWRGRADAYSEQRASLRGSGAVPIRVAMHRVGG
jgi:cyclic pyranopterin phosphate synthase